MENLLDILQKGGGGFNEAKFEILKKKTLQVLEWRGKGEVDIW